MVLKHPEKIFLPPVSTSMYGRSAVIKVTRHQKLIRFMLRRFMKITTCRITETLHLYVGRCSLTIFTFDCESIICTGQLMNMAFPLNPAKIVAVSSASCSSRPVWNLHSSQETFEGIA